MVEALAAALEAGDADAAVGAMVITGDTKAFCAGSDISEQDKHGTGHVFSPARLAAWRRLESAAKPTIAAINGYALGGGCELMMLFDFAIAGEDAVFGMPEINLGIFPGDGGTQRLPRIVGRAVAMQFILTGERIGSRRALELGLVNEVVAADEAVDRAIEIGRIIAAKSRLAVRMAKASILASGQLPLAEGLRREHRNLASVFEGQDWKKGMRAFVEKSTSSDKAATQKE
jgi:enoyl-CoA hydratase